MKCLITGASGYIGTRLIEELLCADPEIQILNVDIVGPRCDEHQPFYRQMDIMDLEGLHSVFQDFKPDIVIHLAASCNFVNIKGVEDYVVNTQGTSNVLEAVKAAPSVKRVFVTSTCFVCQPGYYPKDDMDYSPHTFYGQSKVLSEEITRDANLKCTWAIIRPGTIWGPGKWTQHATMLKLMQRNRYWHPGRKAVSRPMGYIGNAVYQIRKLALDTPDEEIQGRVFYICDPPTNLYEWVNECSERLLGRPVRVLPRCFLSCIALAGDLINKAGKPFPFTTFRYKNMITDFRVPVEHTLETVGKLPYTIKTAVDEWVNWYCQTYGNKSKDK